MNHNIVGLKELRQNLEIYITEVKKGKSFTVVRRSKPVLKISSPDEEELWERVADFTAINKGGVSARKVLAELRRLNAQFKEAPF
jgi:prevent-host-death family protein